MSDNSLKVVVAEVAHYAILKRPLFTEKIANQGIVAFIVDNRSNKYQIREAVERIFKVKVKSVRTCRYSGKPKRVGRSIGYRADTKRAFITLAEGHEINMVEGL